MDKKLTRDTSDKMVAGVASGLANYFQLDVTWVRIAFALAAFFGGGGLWVYIILWIAVPEENEGPFQVTDYKVKSEEPNNFGSTFKPKDKINLNLIGGLVLIGLGSYFLLDEFGIIPYWFHLGKLWPLVFVVIGLSILFKGAKQESQPKDLDTTDFKKKTEESQEQHDKNNEI
jgi:phage shock protein C